jgi:hypothetical protein
VCTKPLLNSISARRRQMIIYGAALSLSQQHSSSFRRCYTRVIILTRTPTFDHNINNNPHGCGSKRRTTFKRGRLHDCVRCWAAALFLAQKSSSLALLSSKLPRRSLETTLPPASGSGCLCLQSESIKLAPSVNLQIQIYSLSSLLAHFTGIVVLNQKVIFCI